MCDETPEAQFLRLLKEEADAFQRALGQSEKAGPAQRENLSRDWFAASSRLLKEYMRVRLQPTETEPPFPWEAIGRMANLAEALSCGRLPQPVQDVTAYGGAPYRWPGNRRDIAVALDYIEHARDGKIQDKAFITSVVKAFQVDRTTVRDWQKVADEIREGFSALPAEGFPEALKKAGARYHFNRTGEKTEGVE